MTDELRPSQTGFCVHIEREYDASPEELWDCWTDPVRLARWLGRPDGPLLGAADPVLMDMGDGDDQWVRVRILVADEPRMLTLQWEFPGVSSSRLRVELIALGPGRTRMVLDHDGLGASSTGYGAGWQAYLDGGLLRETGGAIEEADWERRFAQALPAWRERAAASG
jgi:uncharacterized protein YndB with AHSA1/START domain